MSDSVSLCVSVGRHFPGREQGHALRRERRLGRWTARSPQGHLDRGRDRQEGRGRRQEPGGAQGQGRRRRTLLWKRVSLDVQC